MNGSLKPEQVEKALEELLHAPNVEHEIQIDCYDGTPPGLAELDGFRGPHHECWARLWKEIVSLVMDGMTLEEIEERSLPSIVKVVDSKTSKS